MKWSVSVPIRSIDKSRGNPSHRAALSAQMSLGRSRASGLFDTLSRKRKAAFPAFGCMEGLTEKVLR